MFVYPTNLLFETKLIKILKLFQILMKLKNDFKNFNYFVYEFLLNIKIDVTNYYRLKKNLSKYQIIK